MLIFTVLFYIFCVVFLIQVFFYGFIFSQFTFLKLPKTTPISVPISVIICAKNEAKNLKKYLPSILNQDYPNFEIVLINDSSNDKTLKVMQQFQSVNDCIKVVNVKNIEAFWGNKKYALTLGIKSATYNHILFTDADCKPVSNQWIREMSSNFTREKTIVIGYGAYKKEKKSILNKLIRFETVLTAIQYFSYAKLGYPYMAVGRNLAYTKETFYEARGFMDHMNIMSGDDDLFINQIANSSNTSICFTPDSFTQSIPKKTFSNWIRQKQRHISTASHYKTQHKVCLSVFYFSQVLFILIAMILLCTLFMWEIVAILVVLRYTVVMTNYILATKKLKEQDLILLFPILELFLIATQFSIFIKNIISKPTHWK